MVAKKYPTHAGVLERTHHMLQSGFNAMHSNLMQHSHRGRHGGFKHKSLKKF